MLTEHPLTGTIGAEIEGVDLRQPISADLAGALRQALGRHQVLLVRDQHLSLDELKNLTRAFGAPVRLPYVTPLDGEPEVIAVLKEPEETGGVFGGDWHTDFSFLERPPAGSLLAAEVVPPMGAIPSMSASRPPLKPSPARCRTCFAGAMACMWENPMASSGRRP